jgi:hypothetical protein
MNPNPSKVRVATRSDEEGLVQLCAALNAEIGLFAPDFAKIRTTLREAFIPPVNMRRSIIGIIGREGGPIQGAIYISILQEWYSQQDFCHELFNFVYPEYRAGTNNSHDLISWAKYIADEFNLPLLIGVLSNERTEAKVRHYRKQFGAPRGAYFGYNFADGVM